MSEPVIEIKGMKNFLGGQWVHSDINLTVEEGRNSCHYWWFRQR